MFTTLRYVLISQQQYSDKRVILYQTLIYNKFMLLTTSFFEEKNVCGI